MQLLSMALLHVIEKGNFAANCHSGNEEGERRITLKHIIFM
jgi:hypothetical protein